MSPKGGTGLRPSFERLYKESVGNKKMRRLFLSGALCGVMITAVFTFVFAIPANSDHWRWEIWRRGGGAWTMDKNGHTGWKWMVEPLSDAPLKKPVTVPSSPTDRNAGDTPAATANKNAPAGFAAGALN
ncbi:MAG: hypothetical protein DME52_10120 [Verrucomicrobia bacterium]|nr:MAG: hypothetical protein DME52_10120 [Verrucomicrobiota bacterium]